MKSLIKLIISALCILLYMQALAQITPSDVNNQRDVKSRAANTYSETSSNQGNNSGAGHSGMNQDLGEECSMYFNDWTKASVTLTDGKYLSDRLVRYNIYNQQMEFVHEGDTAAFGDPEEISTVVLNGHEFIYRDFEYEDEVKKGYFEVLVNGDCQLLLHRCIAFRLIEDCSDPNTNFVKEHYYLSQKYFISENCKTAILLPNKKKEIIVMFENSDKDIKSFIKENKIKICKEEDLKDLISYYNSD